MGNAPSTPIELCLANVLTPSALSIPSDPFYHFRAVKVFNTDIHVTPIAVTRPSTTEQVSEIVQCAAKHGYKVQARSGGHSFGNYCLGGKDDAVVIDLQHFQNFSMNETTWYATVGSGTLLRDVTKRMHKAGGRAIPHGTCPQVGIGGHATIGGLGPISRQWGSTLDHVREVEVVLANGTITRASDKFNSDLFFGIKGAGASFGIVTEFIFETRPIPPVVINYSYNIAFGRKKHSEMASIFAAWQEFIADPNLSRKFASQVVIFEFGMMITGTYFGPKEEFDELRFEDRLGQDAQVNIVVLSNWMSSVAGWAEREAMRVLGVVQMPAPFYSKSLAFRQDTLIPQQGIENLFKYLEEAEKSTYIWFAIFDLEGGAINDVPADATAYRHRDTLFYIQTYAYGIRSLPDATRKFVQGINDVILDSMPGVDLGAYPGYVDPGLLKGQEAYWGANLPRLERLKTAVDPDDVFHNPQTVRPLTRDLKLIKQL